jgi:hypothetical protein
MELNNVKITILVSEERISIELKDGDSAITFLKANLTPDQFCSALGRLGQVKVQRCEIGDFSKLGKKLEIDKHRFEIPYELRTSSKSDQLYKIAIETCPEGWTPDNYFASQTTFFSNGDKHYASCVMRRWV